MHTAFAKAGPTTIAELLAARSASRARFVSIIDGHTRALPFSQLLARSAAVAGRLRAEGLATQVTGGSAIAVAVQDPLDFITAFLGVAVAGAAAVPGPVRLASSPVHQKRLGAILAVSRPAAIIVDDELYAAARDIAGRTGTMVVSMSTLAADNNDAAEPSATGSPTCYVQYTSGSTARPKPVEISMANIVAQMVQAAEAFDENPSSVSVNWVPLYHDMGLVTSVLRPLWSDYTSVLLDPFEFVKRPEIWPAAMTEWGATHTSAPDFGYALCAAKVTGAEHFDLSRLRVARNAGEPVRPATLERFAQAFASAGFDYAAFTPSYGLAEATLTVTANPVGEPPRTFTFAEPSLRQDRAREPEEGEPLVTLVSCGKPVRGTEVTIWNEDGERLREDGRIGEVRIAGPQVSTGAIAPSDADGERCRTGDLGFWWKGELVLLGRAKDRFQVRGQNYYSAEIEDSAVAADVRLRPGRAVAIADCAASDPAPRVTVLVEAVRECAELSAADQADIARNVVRAISSGLGLSIDTVHIVPAGTLPLTTSGKVRREKCRDLVEALGTSPLPRPGIRTKEHQR
ncbi:AMP-binding protein [Catenulispora pinisilvae]|nr:AMP-binding protein [Catenulispora pinisilvae]